MATVALGPDGSPQWQPIEGETGEWSSGAALAVDGAGSVVVGGSIMDARGGSNNNILVKHAADGSRAWRINTGAAGLIRKLLIGVGERIAMLNYGKYPVWARSSIRDSDSQRSLFVEQPGPGKPRVTARRRCANLATMVEW